MTNIKAVNVDGEAVAFKNLEIEKSGYVDFKAFIKGDASIEIQLIQMNRKKGNDDRREREGSL